MKTQKIEFTRITNDINGNPRYVCHFLNLLTDAEKYVSVRLGSGTNNISDKYNKAVTRAKKIGGRKYTAKNYGGGIVFQSYNIADTEKSILGLLQ